MKQIKQNTKPDPLLSHLRSIGDSPSKWHTFLDQIFVYGAAALPANPRYGPDPSDILKEIFHTLDPDLPVREHFQNSLFEYYDHLIARRDPARFRKQFVEMHWFLGEVKLLGAFEVLFKELSRESFLNSDLPDAEMFHTNLLVMLKDLSSTPRQQERLKNYLQKNLRSERAPAFHYAALTFYDRHGYDELFGDLARQLALKIQTDKEAEVLVDMWQQNVLSRSAKGLYEWLTGFVPEWRQKNLDGFKKFRRQATDWLNYDNPDVSQGRDPYALLILVALNLYRWLPADLFRLLADCEMKYEHARNDISKAIQTFFQQEQENILHLEEDIRGNLATRRLTSRYSNAVDKYFELDLPEHRLEGMSRRFRLPVKACRLTVFTIQHREAIDRKMRSIPGGTGDKTDAELISIAIAQGA